MPTIDEVEQDLLRRAKDASTAELGTIADAMKAVSEAKYNELNARNKQREIRLETVKSVAAALVPVISVVALFATLVGQSLQIQASRQQIEDTEWRDLLSSLKGVSDTVYTDPVVAPRLRSFFASPLYGEQAKSIAARLMGHISNPDGFRDLFSSVFGEVNRQSIDPVLDIGRTLLASKQALQDQCNQALIGAHIPFDPGLSDCGVYSDDAKAEKLMVTLKVPTPMASQLSTLRRSDVQLDRENSFLDEKIFAYLRAGYQVSRDMRERGGLDLSGLEIVLADFSGLDLSDFNIVGAIFDTVDFRDAILEPKTWSLHGPTGSHNPDFRGSTWWEARRIRPDLLSYLIAYWAPYSKARYPQDYHIDRPAYEAKVRALCTTAAISCPTALSFGAPELND